MMLGYLVKQNGDWMVKYDDNGSVKLYPLCPETKKWSEKSETKKFINFEFFNQIYENIKFQMH